MYNVMTIVDTVVWCMKMSFLKVPITREKHFLLFSLCGFGFWYPHEITDAD